MAQGGVPNASAWQSLRAWVDSREAIERESGRSAITPGQLKIILNLIATNEGPEMDDANYVGRLNEYASQHRLTPQPDFKKEENIPPSVGIGGGGTWRVFCKLPWCDEEFPKLGYGFEQGEQPPSFQVKKVAKQYAAKMALEYLHDGNSARAMLFNSPVTTPSFNMVRDDVGSTPRPSPNQPRIGENSNQGGVWVGQNPVNAGTSSTKPASGDVSDEAVSLGQGLKVQQMVQGLAHRLNFKLPTYKISPEDGRPGFYEGVAQWRKEALAPEVSIRVDGVFGETQALEQVAAKVYEWLSKQEQTRKAELASIMDEIAGAKA